MDKDFNNFLKSITEEKINKFFQDNNDIELNFPFDEEGLKKLISSISDLNIQVMLGILKLYHDWLNS